jgi:hypothetical protein
MINRALTQFFMKSVSAEKNQARVVPTLQLPHKQIDDDDDDNYYYDADRNAEVTLTLDTSDKWE